MSNRIGLLVKRVFDLAFSLFGLIVTWPLLLILAVWIKLDSKGPVFYSGVRVGRLGKPIRVIKFRTMVVDADKIGGPSTSGMALVSLVLAR